MGVVISPAPFILLNSHYHPIPLLDLLCILILSVYTTIGLYLLVAWFIDRADRLRKERNKW
jgi:hypothetical protein